MADERALPIAVLVKIIATMSECLQNLHRLGDVTPREGTMILTIVVNDCMPRGRPLGVVTIYMHRVDQ